MLETGRQPVSPPLIHPIALPEVMVKGMGEPRQGREHLLALAWPLTWAVEIPPRWFSVRFMQ